MATTRTETYSHDKVDYKSITEIMVRNGHRKAISTNGPITGVVHYVQINTDG